MSLCQSMFRLAEHCSGKSDVVRTGRLAGWDTHSINTLQCHHHCNGYGASRQLELLSQPHCRDGPGARSWAECGAAAHARCVAPTLDHFGANSGQKRPGIRPASLGHGAPRERQRHRSVRRTKTAYFSHCGWAHCAGPVQSPSTLPSAPQIGGGQATRPRCNDMVEESKFNPRPQYLPMVFHPSDRAGFIQTTSNQLHYEALGHLKCEMGVPPPT